MGKKQSQFLKHLDLLKLSILNFLYYSSETDINECLTNNGGCQQLCHNAQGSFTCDCNVGYTLNSNKKKCNGKNVIITVLMYTKISKILILLFEDINECVKNTDGCNQNCINTAGSYQCSCNSGYELGLDSQTCVGE